MGRLNRTRDARKKMNKTRVLVVLPLKIVFLFVARTPNTGITFKTLLQHCFGGKSFFLKVTY